jgi:hypothetical protein
MPLHPEFDDPIQLWPQPDLSVLHSRRDPPPLLIEVFGPAWGAWITRAAEAASAPRDYVAAPLLAAASALIGNARWAQATPGWSEPPHMWVGVVGDSGVGKSPGAACLLRDVLPAIERKMLADFPDRLQEWRANSELGKAAEERWKTEVREAQKAGKAPPLPPPAATSLEPQAPRLQQHDVTIKKVASLLAYAAPKGLLICRDELVGWIDSMTAYNVSGRSFWVEAYVGGPFRVERQKHPEPIIVPRNVVAVFGGTQPDKVAMLMRDADDGLLARIAWVWPNPVPFSLGGRGTPGAEWAIAALDKLRELELQPGDPPSPIMVKLADDALPLIEAFGREMQEKQQTAGGLFRSALGKARGQALRLALTLEYLWWAASEGIDAPPIRISKRAFAAAAGLVGDYFVPMAMRVCGDVSIPEADRLAVVVARWILSFGIAAHPNALINARDLRLRAGLPGLREAEKVNLALAALVEADWLVPAPSRAGSGSGRRRADYLINPRLKGMKDGR